MPENINLVQKKNDRRAEKPPCRQLGADIRTAVNHTLEEDKALGHTVLARILQQRLVVLAQRYAKDDRRHRLEAVDPLAPLAALSTDVHEVDG